MLTRFLQNAWRPIVIPSTGVSLQRKCACGGSAGVTNECDGCSKKELSLQRATQDTESGKSQGVPSIVYEVLRSPGQPLDAGTRAFFEPRFGHDFSNVRVHTDSQAARSAQAVNALAYTVGRDVVFADGQYAPQISSGQKILAHELVHVLQQRGTAGASGPTLTVGQPEDQHEQEADSMAEAAMETRESRVHGLNSLSVTADSSVDLVRRVVNYLRQLPPDESQPYLERFDRSVTSLEADIQNPHAPLPADVTQAVTILRSLRREGRVTCWETSGGLNYASYDNASRELRLHIVHPQATNPTTLLHEAIHALHAASYPGLSRAYGESLAAGGTTDVRRGIIFRKWKAWTEYWAYRRVVEYDNARQTDPTFRRDPHQAAMAEQDVRRSLAAVRELGVTDFDPQTWTPPAEFERIRPADRPRR